MNDFVNVPHERTEAMRLVPDRVLTETLYWMARAYERVHSMPRVSDTELANKIEAAKADLGRARDASPILSNSAAPAPEGGVVKGPGDYTMSLTDPQAFERFPALASQIERMAVGRSVGSLIEWDAFLRELNAALAAREEAQPVGWTGSGSIDALKAGVEGHMWPTKAAAHPLALYAHPATDALRIAVEALEMIRDSRTKVVRVADARAVAAKALAALQQEGR